MVAMVTEMRSCCFGWKKIVINLKFGSSLSGFQDRFRHRTEKMFAVYLEFSQ